MYIRTPGGLSPEAQYFELGNITNRALRTSRPSAITEFSFCKLSGAEGAKEKLLQLVLRARFGFVHDLFVWLPVTALRAS